MKTLIFESYSAFLDREDKEINGVSAEFAERVPNYEAQNETNKGCWNCSDCSRCSGCYGCYDCYGCSDCSDCSRCSRCSGCSGCSRCSDLKENAPSAFPAIPVIENIHQKVFEAASGEGALNMGDWHSCDTTPCRAGWVTFLAGEAGKALEKHTSTAFAAMQIYKASSPINVSPVRFYEDNKVAMADIKRCAEEEAATLKPGV